MKRKCPPNTFCFDRTLTIVTFVIFISILGVYLYNNNIKINNITSSIHNIMIDNHKNKQNEVVFKNRIEDRLQDRFLEHKFINRINNPLLPPNRTYPVNKASINIPTRGEASPFQQIGVLIENDATSDSKKLPLYGSKLHSGSSNWKYYTSSDGYHNVKLPIVKNNKNCLDNYGCQEINDNDDVTIKGYDSKTFKISLYPMELPRIL